MANTLLPKCKAGVWVNLMKTCAGHILPQNKQKMGFILPILGPFSITFMTIKHVCQPKCHYRNAKKLP